MAEMQRIDLDSPDVVGPVVTTADLYRAAWAASLGSALEYYDFALYNLASALIFGPLFFASGDPAVGMIASFGTYFLGFAVRPVGGVILGMYGDRLGRKFVLTATILLMGAASTGIGLLPTYAQAGIWSPTLLILMRLLQGLGAGAEQAGAAVLMAEYAPPARRGWFAALPFMGIQLGTVLAALVYFLVLRRIENPADSWLWRVPFLLSVVIIGVALWIRAKLKESPTFAKLKAREQVTRNPLAVLLRGSRASVLRVIGLRMAENGSSSIHQSLAVSFVVQVAGLSSQVGTVALLAAGLSGAIVVPLTGLLSDRVGRVPVYRAFALFQMLAAFPVWWVLSRGDATSSVAAISFILLGVWGMFATQGAMLPEMFGATHRYIGVAVGRELSAVIAGGIAPLIGAFIIARTKASYGGTQQAALLAWVPIAGYVAILSLVSFLTTFRTPETRGGTWTTRATPTRTRGPEMAGLFSLAGRRALVTGSSAGIGLALARGLAQAGAQVVLNGRDAGRVEAAAAALAAEGIEAARAPFDVTSGDAARDGIARIEAEAGPIDILVNNAGIQRRAPLEDFPEAAWHEIVAANLDSVFLVSQAAARFMIPRRRGAIINIASVQSELGRPGIAPYAATKGGVKMLTKGMAIDWGRHGIRVNAIGPGYFKTELNAALVADPAFSGWLTARTPLGRWGETQELVGAAVFLASDAAGFVTGQVLYVDGGVTAQL